MDDEVPGELVETPHGPARLHRLPAAGELRGTLLLGHGAGGSVTAPDLQAVANRATGAGVQVVLVEQPYRVAGRRSAAPAKQLDAAWGAVVEHLRADGSLAGRPLLTGGRSSGARVACRTAAASGAAGVLCLAFPLITPKLASRQDELDAVTVPVLIIQGRTDRFGMPQPAPPLREVVQVDGDHGLKRDLPVIADAATAWLERLTAA